MARMILISSQSSSMAGWELSGTIEAYLLNNEEDVSLSASRTSD